MDLSGGEKGLTGLTRRERVAFLLYGFGLALMAVSLPMVFLGLYEPRSTWDTLVEVGKEIYERPGAVTAVDSWSDMVRGPIPFLSFLLSYVLVLPGVFLLFFGCRNVWFCWTGRLLWPALWIGGPLVSILLDFSVGLDPLFRGGRWVWATWLFLVSMAHWVGAPRRTGEGPGGPVGGGS
ncbi:MAG: hypothetical protein GWO24_08915 [Akkermansiaceae bacterium]|nr:hypothetical protein [Akkermansiaceae bacterium]